MRTEWNKRLSGEQTQVELSGETDTARLTIALKTKLSASLGALVLLAWPLPSIAAESCQGGGATSVSGKVYAPNGTLPLPNVLVYVPTKAIASFAQTVGCSVQGEAISGSPLVSTVSANDGSFTLNGVPANTSFQLVIQTGRWRRVVTIDPVSSCTNTSLTPTQTRLPSTKTEGDIPQFAVVTGSIDTEECLLRKIGLADSEFTNPTANGRIHLYSGATSAGATINASAALETQLENTISTLKKYDQILMSCQGRSIAPTTERQENIKAYVNAGGRLFASHYAYAWLTNTFSAVAKWLPNQSAPSPDPQTATINTGTTKGLRLAAWLQATGATTTQGQLSLAVLRKDHMGVNPPTQALLSLNNSDVMQFSFDTPLDESKQCGRVVFMEHHPEDHTTVTGMTFPDECTGGTAMTAQERVFAFELFDLSNAAPTYTVSPSANAGGTISPSTPQEISLGTTASFTVTPNPGFVANLSGSCGGTLSGTSYTTNAINADCTVVANFTQVQFSGSAANGSGTVTAALNSESSTCGFSSASFVPVSGTAKSPPNLPTGVSFPYGLFDFVTSGCSTGVDITLTYPQTLAAGASYWKYGPTQNDHQPHWYTIPATISGNRVSLHIVDGGLGDDDLEANGAIVDQGGLGLLEASNVENVPTLNEYLLSLLCALLGIIGMLGLRKIRIA